MDLLDLYRRYAEELKSKCANLLTGDYSNPHCVYVPDDWAAAKNRVMIVGEEGYGAWGQGKQAGLTLSDIEKIQKANGKIVDYILAKDNDNRKFWRRFKSISDFDVPCIWNNLDKIYYMGKNRKRCCLTTTEENLLHSTNIKILKEEINILKPSIVIFFGWYNNALNIELPAIYEKLNPNGSDRLWKNSLYKIEDNGIDYIFTYHPSWRGKYKPVDYEKKVVDCVACCLK